MDENNQMKQALPPEDAQVVGEETPVESCTLDEQAVTVEQLSARVRELEQELELRATLSDRMARECDEFEVYFPEVSLRTLPDSVWAQVHAGVPLAAAYALYERGVQNRERAEMERSARKEAHSTGLPGAAQPSYFSPSQVRAMSRQEVRENYDRIFESMRHWQ